MYYFNHNIRFKEINEYKATIKNIITILTFIFII
jgi:hypothetical protein